MPHDVIMPALGMAQDTGLIVAWLKAPGDAVKAGDPLMEVETDKATMEVEAQSDGYLTEIRAEAGANVPVGRVVAVIGDSPDAEATAAAPEASTEPATPSAPTAEDLPNGQPVIMPALGMAQDTGLLVAWHKAPGDAVAADDVLLEVETDKSTMEVPAGVSGFVAALLAEAGQEVPVGETIALISAEKPANPVARPRGNGPAPAPAAPQPTAPPAAKAAEPAAPAPTRPKPATQRAIPAPGGRILASPKARRLAAEQGLDLARLVAAGVPQPYHVADLETLRALRAPAEQAAPATAAASLHLTAAVAAKGLDTFLDWIAAEAGARADPGAVLAGLAAGALRPNADGALTVAVESFGQRRVYADPDRAGLGRAPQGEGAPALILRDLRGSALTGLRLGPEEAPVLTLTGRDPLTLTLEAAAGALTPAAALDLMTGFAGRLEEPLRHLL